MKKPRNVFCSRQSHSILHESIEGERWTMHIHSFNQRSRSKSSELVSLLSFTHSPFSIQSVNTTAFFSAYFSKLNQQKNHLTPHRFVSNDNFEIEANILLFVAFPFATFNSLNNKYMADKQSQRQLFNKFHLERQRKNRKKYDSYFDVRRTA